MELIKRTNCLQESPIYMQIMLTLGREEFDAITDTPTNMLNELRTVTYRGLAGICAL